MFDIDPIILPTPNPPFEWHRTASGAALVCRELAPYAAHLFTTRGWDISSAPSAESPYAWTKVAAALGVDRSRLVRARQVHGNHAIVAESGDDALTDGDIIVSRSHELAVAVQAADCVPLLLVDRRGAGVAAAHAGWRGLASRVPHAAVSILEERFGVVAGELLAAVGPSIGGCCYQVGIDVRDRFMSAGFPREQIESWFSHTPVSDDMNPSLPGLAGGEAGRWYFDTWRCARQQLEAAGVAPERIFVAGLCTASHPHVFCSYRRDGSAAGRLAGAIRLRTRDP